MSEPVTLSNYIGGEFVPPQQEDYLDDLAPATGELVARVPKSIRKDVNAAVSAARAAFEGPWSTWSTAMRADLLDAVADAIEARLYTLAEIESRDTGKPIKLASAVDIPRAVLNFRFFAGAIRHDHTEMHPMEGALNYTLRKPIGVAGLITPWNLPIYLLSWKVAPALAMGNTVVAKPSELTPLTANALAEIFNDVGAPPGVFNLVHGMGDEAGESVVTHPDVPLISFTGGTSTGRLVSEKGAPIFKKLSLELGGKNATIVFADSDFDAALAGAVRAGFVNQGQVCLCGSRILIERKIYDRFAAAITAKVSEMRIGDPASFDTELGALISASHREKVESYVDLAREEGGEILTGGGRPEFHGPLASGFFTRPAVIGGLSPDSRCATEEIFGPIVTLHPFDTEEEAIKIANGVRYGLCASVWTRDLSRAHRVSAALDTGMVWVNTWLLRDLRVPFGGMKDSGVGREGGRYSLEFFSEARNVCIKL